MKEENLERRQYEVIDVLRFPLIILVLFVHILPMVGVPIEPHLTGINLYHFLSEMVSHTVGKLLVPCFFLFSGFLFFHKLDVWSWEFYGNQLRKRVKTLLLPYMLWNLFMMLAIWAKAYSFSFLSLPAADAELVAIHDKSWLYLLWQVPVNFPLWYLRDLICMCVLAPLFYLFFRSLKIYGVFVLVALYLTVCELDVAGLSMMAFLFFGIGAYCAINKKNMIIYSSKVRYIATIIFLLFLFITTWHTGRELYEYIGRVFTLFGVITAINLGNWLVNKESWKNGLIRMAPTVFFIYAVHEIFIINWVKGFFSRTPLAESGVGLMISYVLIPFITLGICLALYFVLRRFVPRLLAISTGGRLKL